MSERRHSRKNRPLLKNLKSNTARLNEDFGGKIKGINRLNTRQNTKVRRLRHKDGN